MITVGFVAIIALFGLQHAYLPARTRKAQELAERDLEAGDELSAEFEALSAADRPRSGTLAGLIVVVTIFFMVVKP